MTNTSILVCALGGEGGGVLTEWLVDACRHAGLAVQSTSVPGVAQRTGATTYYIEVHPTPLAELGAKRPVFGLTPVPGALDLVVSSELLETVRQLGNGMADPRRTLVVTSTGRTLTTTERTAPGDGRLDADRLLAIVGAASRRSAAFDMGALARESNTVVSAVMLGAIAGSGVLPLPRRAYEDVVRGVDTQADAKLTAVATASLAGFAAAYDRVSAACRPAGSDGAREGRTAPHEPTAGNPAESLGTFASAASANDGARPAAVDSTAPPLPSAAVARFPAALHDILALGHARLAAYQDARYAAQYLDRVETVLAAERAVDPDGAGEWRVARETARRLAVWMAFDDLVRVAGLKCSASRAARVRRETKAGTGDVVKVWDHFKPGVPEVAALLPERLATRLAAWDARRVAGGAEPWALPIKLGAHTVLGTLLLRALMATKPLRRAGRRWHEEQALIERWLAAVVTGTRDDARLGVEIARAAKLVKGYGATNERGKARLLDVVMRLAAGPGDAHARADAVAAAIAAAGRDDTGQALDTVLAQHGIAPRGPAERPIRFVRRLPTRPVPPAPRRPAVG